MVNTIQTNIKIKPYISSIINNSSKDDIPTENILSNCKKSINTKYTTMKQPNIYQQYSNYENNTILNDTEVETSILSLSDSSDTSYTSSQQPMDETNTVSDILSTNNYIDASIQEKLLPLYIDSTNIEYNKIYQSIVLPP